MSEDKAKGIMSTENTVENKADSTPETDNVHYVHEPLATTDDGLAIYWADTRVRMSQRSYNYMKRIHQANPSHPMFDRVRPS